MSVAFRAAATGTKAAGSGLNLTINVPAGTMDGDVMVAVVLTGTATTAATQAGWTTLDTETTGPTIRSFYRIASSEPASYVFTVVDAQSSVGIISTYSGAHASTPINQHGAWNRLTSTVNVSGTSITPSVDNCMIVFLGGGGGATSVLPPSGYTERGDITTGGVVVEAAELLQTSAAATGTVTGTASASTNTQGSLVAIAPFAAEGITETFSIASGSDDDEGESSDFFAGGWPPDGFWSDDPAIPEISVTKKLDTDWFQETSFFRWDTSSIPSNATITSATLNLYIVDANGVDNYSLQGDWYDYGGSPTVEADRQEYPPSPILSIDIDDLVLGGVNSIPITDLTGINKSGYTGIRLNLSSGTPTGDNHVDIVAFEHATLPPARLDVTYTLAVGGRRIYKRLYGPAHLPTAAATLYTVPTGTKTTIRRIWANNPSGSPVDFTFAIGGYSSVVQGLNPTNYWRLGESAGLTAVDQRGANNITYSGTGLTYGVSGLTVDPDTAVTFDEVAGKITGYDLVNNPATQSVVAWIKSGAANDQRAIWSRRNGAGPSGAQYWGTGAGGFVFAYMQGDGTGVYNGTTDLYDDVPHMITWTLAGAALKVYVDGSGTPEINATLDAGWTGATGSVGTSPFHIGWDGAVGEFFNGTIDEVAFWNGTALTAANVQALYAAGSTGAAAPSIYDSENIPAGGEVEENRDHTLEAGETIQAYAGSATTVVLVVDGIEESI